MPFTNSVQDLTADTVTAVTVTSDVGDITTLNATDVNAEQIALGGDSDTIHAIQWGTYDINFSSDVNQIGPLIATGLGYSPIIITNVAGRSTFASYVWVNDGVNIQFGARQVNGATFTGVVTLYYILIG